MLAAIKSDPDLQRIPVIVLSGSLSVDDEEHANGCLTKPGDPKAFGAQIEVIAEWWLSTLARPPGAGLTDTPER